MKNLVRYFATISVCLCLTACWIPEKFKATLHIDKTKNFTFKYEGTIIFGPALDEIKKKGQLSATGEDDMKKAQEALRKEPGFKKVDYAGDGRFKVQFEETGPVQDRKSVFIGIIEFRIESDGSIWVLGTNITPTDSLKLSQFGLKLDGSVVVTSELKVLHHNATSTESLVESLNKTYKWIITLDQKERPTIVFQP